MRRWRAGVKASREQVQPFAEWWSAHNAGAMAADGPLWVALGDSTAQGLGTGAPDRGYAGQLLSLLRDKWDAHYRLLNLSVSGAKAETLLRLQLPRLSELGESADLVTCAIGGNDLLRTRRRTLERTFRAIISGLPPGSVIGTLPQGLNAKKAMAVNALIRHEAPAAGLVVADIWKRTGPPWDGKYAADGFHPNEVGYGLWRDAFAEALGHL